MNINLIHFDTSVGVKKPRTMLKSSIDSCPFCDVEHLTDIIEIEGDMIFLKNKYVVIEGSDQFVIIEGSECHSDMPRYSKEKMHRLIRFGLKHWKNLLDSGKYEDVLFFKNYGELSGGTIRHPHMQLVGFPKLNRDLLFDPIELHGEIIFESDGVEINISTTPRVGFGEINIIPPAGNFIDSKSLDTFADFIQIGIDYLTKHFRKDLSSYNIFFYHRENSEGIDQIYTKLIPRFATSPYFVGYNIHFVPNNVKTLAQEIRQIYFS